MKSKLIVFGIAKHAELVAELARSLPEFEFIGFTANRRFITSDCIGNYPLHPFEELAERWNPAEHSVHVALEYSRQSADRARLMGEAEQLGYSIASLIHPNAIIAPSAVIGRHALICEGVIIQSCAKIGANVAIHAGSLVKLWTDRLKASEKDHHRIAGPLPDGYQRDRRFQPRRTAQPVDRFDPEEAQSVVEHTISLAQERGEDQRHRHR